MKKETTARTIVSGTETETEVAAKKEARQTMMFHCPSFQTDAFWVKFS